MKNKNFLHIVVFSLLPLMAFSQINFSEHIAPIIYENCTSCHRAGEIGPIPFTNYQEVKDWAGMIQYVTEIKYMPPWPPEAEYRHFVNERVLTEGQIHKIADWVAAGTPEGDPTLEPELPTFPTGSQIGVPDLVLEMEEAHDVVGNNQDDYQIFVLPMGFTEDKEIASIEFRPDNKRAVHHVLYAYDVTGQAAALDAATPDYGYYSFGDFGFDEAVYLSWAYVPGNLPIIYPKGIGEIIPAGADLLIQVHYAPLPTDETDQSSINIFFKDADDPIERPIIVGTVLPFNLPGGWGSFQIPADEEITFKATSFYEGDNWFTGVNYNISLISIDAHSHYLGTSYEMFAVMPAGDTLPLLKIPNWDFNWQGTYTFNKMIKLPAGTELYTIASYDNTSDNPSNPSFPPIDVSWGEGTQDEMLLSGIYYVPYEEGDENIELGNDGTTSTVEVNATTNSLLYPPTPNPTNGDFKVSFYLEQKENLQFDLFDINGKHIKTLYQQAVWTNGGHTFNVNTSDLIQGNYFIKMTGENYILSQKLLVLK